MELVELTTPPSEALPLDAYKAHLRLGSGFSNDSLQDELLEAFLRAAIAAIEARIDKALLAREVEWHIERWSDGSSQPLPIAPVSQVEGIALITATGDITSVDPETYQLIRDTQRPQVQPTQSCLPDIPTGGSAAIHMFAGYGPSWNDVPDDLAQAVLLLATYYYENRQAAGGSADAMPFGVLSLLEPYRVVRVFGARS